MLITIDIGNTHVDLGLFSDGVLMARDRMPTHPKTGTPDHATQLIRFVETHAEYRSINQVLVASVVRDLDTALIASCHQYELPAQSVDSRWELGLQIRYDNPQHVGIDRLLAASAALAEAPADTALIIADAGTAITVDLVDAGGTFLGGTIAPGLQTMLKSLHSGTSLLPEVELGDYAPLPARNTADGIRSGVLHGGAAMIDGLCERLGENVTGPTQSILTGGDAQRLYPFTRSIQSCDSTLVLRGLYWAYERNKLTL